MATRKTMSTEYSRGTTKANEERRRAKKTVRDAERKATKKPGAKFSASGMKHYSKARKHLK